jgi:uncharacterized membrane protein YGL010W
MRPAIELLSQYAEFHRDRRNIASHFIGVPMIVFAVGLLLARPSVPMAGLLLTPAWVLFGIVTMWYLTRGNVMLGIAVSGAIAILVLLAHKLGAGSGFAWLGWGIGLFVAGWTLQFAGHWYEGRRPVFVDDLVGLLVGPMFVTAEVLFALGWNRPLLAQIEQRVGPTVLRDLAKIA